LCNIQCWKQKQHKRNVKNLRRQETGKTYSTESDVDLSEDDGVIDADDGDDDDDDDELQGTSNAVRSFLKHSKPHRSAPPLAVHARKVVSRHLPEKKSVEQ